MREQTDIHHHHAFLPAPLLRPGLHVSKDVADYAGRVIAREGSVLDEPVIKEIQARGVIGVWIRQKHESSHLLPTAGKPAVEAPIAETVPAATPADAATEAAASPTILIADDEPNIRRILRYVLEKANYRVLEAANGYQVMDLVVRHKVDAILMDSMIAPATGLVACRALKDDSRTGEIKVIVCSARVDETHYQEAWDAGADDFIEKPFRMERVIDTLHAHLAAGG